MLMRSSCASPRSPTASAAAPATTSPKCSILLAGSTSTNRRTSRSNSFERIPSKMLVSFVCRMIPCAELGGRSVRVLSVAAGIDAVGGVVHADRGGGWKCNWSVLKSELIRLEEGSKVTSTIVRNQNLIGGPNEQTTSSAFVDIEGSNAKQRLYCGVHETPSLRAIFSFIKTLIRH